MQECPEIKGRFERTVFEAPDLQHVGKNAYRFVNAVSDFATHARPLRMSETTEKISSHGR